MTPATKFIPTLLLILYATTSIFGEAQNRGSAKKVKRSLYQSIDEQAVKRVEPTYNQHLRLEGNVVVRVEVDEKGDVISAKAISGHPLLRGFAVEAAKNWKFAPKLYKGKPVSNKGTIRIHFPSSWETERKRAADRNGV
jgi:TonB family protein